MSPSKFIDEFPKSTNSSYISKANLNNELANGKCKLLVENRKYIAQIALSVQGDVISGARGVDEWVEADSGNAYVLNNFEWISVGDQGVTQLVVYFDTLYCK